MSVEQPKKCRCGEEAEVAPCPYGLELYGDEEVCQCCDECRRQCSMNI